jgi:hypothetical protein
MISSAFVKHYNLRRPGQKKEDPVSDQKESDPVDEVVVDLSASVKGSSKIDEADPSSKPAA